MIYISIFVCMFTYLKGGNPRDKFGFQLLLDAGFFPHFFWGDI